MESQESSFIDTLLQKALIYRKECLMGGAAMLATVGLVIGIASGGPSYRDFLKTKNAFAKWEASPTDTDLFDALLVALKKTPTLSERYDAEIAQRLIEANLSEKAIPYAARSIARLQNEVPLHASFAETSLLIEKGSFQEALERAIGLKERMGTDDPVLYAHNLLRIACLQQALQNGPGEMAAWGDFEDFLGWKEGPTETTLSHEMLQSYHDNEINLSHYIAQRKVTLSREY